MKTQNEAMAEQQQQLLKTLTELNKGKAESLVALQQSINTPSLENLEKLLAHICTELAGVDKENPMFKMLVVMSHKMAAVLDVPEDVIQELYERYNVLPPKFKE